MSNCTLTNYCKHVLFKASSSNYVPLLKPNFLVSCSPFSISVPLFGVVALQLVTLAPPDLLFPSVFFFAWCRENRGGGSWHR